jgi:Flp pilus assembly protein TadB
VNEDETIQGGPQRPPWIAYSVIAIIAIGALVAFYVSQESEAERRERRSVSAKKGTSCEALSSARSALSTDDDDAVKSSLREAERMALRALDTSGIAFGKPERIALSLTSDLREKLRSDQHDSLSDRLEVAADICNELRSS